MGCGQSKAARAVEPLPAAERVAVGGVEVEAEPQLISMDRAPAESDLEEAAAQKRAEEAAAATKTEEEVALSQHILAALTFEDHPSPKTTAAPAAAMPRTVAIEEIVASGTGGSGGGSGAAHPPGKHAPASLHPPAHRPTLPPVEVRGGKLGDFSSMVRTIEARLERSLEDVTGAIDPQQVLRALYMEHCEGPEALERFESCYGFETCAKEEFWCVVEDAAPKVASKIGVGVRDGRLLSEVLKSAEVEKAKLADEEVVALRLLTGPMYEVYNLSLRGGGIEAKDGGSDVRDLRFATTCLLISSGLGKLARVGAALKGDAVYRGLGVGGEQLAAGLLEKDGKGFASVVDLSFLSVTEDRAEAERHAARADAGSEEGGLRTILEIQVGKTSMGAHLGWVSQFPEEGEIVYPPRTHLEVVGEPRVEEGVRVITLRPTVDQSVRTLEQMRAARKEGVLELVHSLGWDMRHEAQREGELGPRRGAIDAWERGLLANRMLTQDAGWYTDNGKFRQVVTLVFEEWEKGRGEVCQEARKAVEVEGKGVQGGESAAATGGVQVQAPQAPTAVAEEGTVGSGARDDGVLDDVAALHAKFFQDPNFGGRRGKYSGVDAFDAGIERQVGKMDVNVSKAMAAEHTMSEDSEEAFFAPNTRLWTTPLDEWLFVLGVGGCVSATGEIVEGGRPENEVLVKGRNAKSLEHLRGLVETLTSELTMAELVALRLYTGPMYVLHNGVLRGFYSRNLYTTTLHLIVSGLRKLCRITAPPPKNEGGERVAYRGTGGMALPADFFQADGQGFAGGVEAGFMGTTLDLAVAMHYSGVGGGAQSGGGLRTVFRYLVGEQSLGADVSWLSQFEEEKEMLFGPMTHMQMVGKPRVEEGGVSAITVRPTVSQRSRTLEQVERGRCDGLLQLGASLVSDVWYSARKNAVWELCKDLIEGQGVAVTEEVEGRAATAYNDNVTYRDTVLRLIDLSEEGRTAVAERVREEGLKRRDDGDRVGALEHLHTTITVTEELCANDRARMDWLAETQGEVAGMHGESGVRAADSKTALAQNLQDQGEYEKALKLAKEALGIYLTELSDEEHMTHIGIASACDIMGCVYNNQGKYQMALEQMEKSLAITIKVLGEHHQKVAITYNNIAQVYDSQGKHEMALEQYFKCLAIQIKALGEDHPSVATTYNNIGNVYANQGKPEMALEQFDKCLAIQIKELGEDHPSVATTKCNIAGVYQKKGEHEMALELYFKSLAIQIKALGENHPSVAGTYHKIGTVYKDQFKHEMALEQFENCQVIQIKALGEDHPSVATTYNNIASVYDSQGKYKMALELYEKGLAMLIKTLGENHPSVATTYNNIARVYFNEEKHEMALELFAKCLAIQMKVLGENHPSVADTYNNIASIYNSQRKFEMALELYEKCLAINIKALGEDHPSVACTYSNIATTKYNLASTLAEQGELARAGDFFRECAAIYSKTLGAQHEETVDALEHARCCELGMLEPESAISKNELAKRLADQGEYEKALVLLTEALGIYKEELSDEEQQQHIDVALTYSIMGIIYIKQDKDEMALEQFETCLVIRIKALGEDHPSVANVYNNIAIVYFNQGKYEMALEQYFKCLAIQIKALGEDHQEVADTYQNIANVYKKQGKHEMVLGQYEKCLAIQIKALGEDHPSVATTKFNIAGVYQQKGELARAAGLFRESAAIYSKVFGAEDDKTLAVLQLCQLCDMGAALLGLQARLAQQ